MIRNSKTTQPDPSIVAIAVGEGAYFADPPYSPAAAYPESPIAHQTLSTRNEGYHLVREALRLTGLDSENFGTPQWNPLGSVVTPGDTVVLKPNFIRDFHDTDPNEIESVITHGSIIRAALDYTAIALQGRGKVLIADAPQCESNFNRIKAFTGLDEIQSLYREQVPIKVEIIDLRQEYTEKMDGVIVGHRTLPGDPAGYTRVNLGRHSEFMAVNHMNHRLYGSEYDRSEVAAHHHGETHEYLISKSIMDAGVFINLPKMKTHKKVGATLNLKNLVGINGNKNWLPHHREGVPRNGGDQFANSGLSEYLEYYLGSAFKKHFPKLGRLRKLIGGHAKKMGRAAFGDTNTDRIRSGNWHGNDTTWRMVLDLNRALRYADGTGTLNDSPRRRYFSILDGIVAGDGNGPMDTTPKPCGVVLAGTDPLSVDLVCVRLMGFDYEKMRLMTAALKPHDLGIVQVPYEEIQGNSNDRQFDKKLTQFEGPCFAFKPHFGWTGNIELTSRASSSQV